MITRFFIDNSFITIKPFRICERGTYVNRWWKDCMDSTVLPRPRLLPFLWFDLGFFAAHSLEDSHQLTQPGLSRSEGILCIQHDYEVGTWSYISQCLQLYTVIHTQLLIYHSIKYLIGISEAWHFKVSNLHLAQTLGNGNWILDIIYFDLNIDMGSFLGG